MSLSELLQTHSQSVSQFKQLTKPHSRRTDVLVLRYCISYPHVEDAVKAYEEGNAIRAKYGLDIEKLPDLRHSVYEDLGFFKDRFYTFNRFTGASYGEIVKQMGEDEEDFLKTSLLLRERCQRLMDEHSIKHNVLTRMISFVEDKGRSVFDMNMTFLNRSGKASKMSSVLFPQLQDKIIYLDPGLIVSALSKLAKIVMYKHSKFFCSDRKKLHDILTEDVVEFLKETNVYG